MFKSLKKLKKLFTLGIALALLHFWLISAWTVVVNASETINQPQENLDLSLKQVKALSAQGNFLSAISLLETLAHSTQEKSQLAYIYYYLGKLYRQIGSLRESIFSWEQAIEIYEQIKEQGAQLHLSKVRIELAQVYNILGQYEKAISLLEEAQNQIGCEEILNCSEVELNIVIFGVMGSSYLLKGDFDKAIELYGHSLELAKTSQNSTYEVTALNNLTNAFWRKYLSIKLEAKTMSSNGQDSEIDLNALDSLLKSAYPIGQQAINKSAQKGGLPQVVALINMITLLLESNSYQPNKSTLGDMSSTAYIDTARNILDKLPDTIDKAIQLIALASKVEQFTAKIDLLSKAAAIALKLGASRYQSLAMGELGKVYLKFNQFDKALQYTEQSVLISQSINAFDLLYKWLWQLGQIYKARGLFLEALTAYRQSLTTIASIRGDIAKAYKNYQLDYEVDIEPIYREFLEILLKVPHDEQLKEAIDVINSLSISELQSFFGDECIQLNSTFTSIDLAQEAIAIIYSVILEQKAYLILRLPDGVLYSYPIEEDVKKLLLAVKNWRRDLENPSTNRYKTGSLELYNLLIKPMEAVLKTTPIKSIIFVNDSILRNVPMSALFDGEQFLIEKYPIGVTLNLNFLKKPAESMDFSNSLIFGLSQQKPPFDSLPFVEQETSDIQKILQGNRFINLDFTKKIFRRQVEEEVSSIIHLATHASFGSTVESAFLQAFDGKISLTELEEIFSSTSSPVELVTLSACETAAGNSRSILGLAGVAIRSGVKSTLGSLWVVNDATTAELITDFYKNLTKPGVNKTEALRLAQLTQIATKSSHPSSWASFVLIGY